MRLAIALAALLISSPAFASVTLVATDGRGNDWGVETFDMVDASAEIAACNALLSDLASDIERIEIQPGLILPANLFTLRCIAD